MPKNSKTNELFQNKILIVDDEKDIRSLMHEIFTDEGYQVSVAANGVQARNAWRDEVPDLIFLDVWMPDVDGVSLLKEMETEQLLEHTTVVMMSGHGTIETAIEATRIGAYDFMEKPLSLAKLLVTAERALERNRLQHENQHLKTRLPGLVMPVGNSKLMREQRSTIERLAKYTMPILVTGETGSGKHFFARAVHLSSARKKNPIQSLSAKEFSENLTTWLGCSEQKNNVVGDFEKLKGGTLVLSNIELLSLEAQAVLVDLIFEEGYRRQGSDKLYPLDLRVICSTRNGLESFVEKGEFREDLFKRLNVMPIVIPALRQHNEDIPELVEYFVQYFKQHDDLEPRKFNESTFNLLRQYAWPGNLRELQNLVQRLLILGQNSEVSEDEIRHSLTQSSQQYYNGTSLDTSVELRTAKEQFESAYLKQLLRETSSNVAETAKRSGIERTHLYRKLKTLGIDPKDPI